MTEWFEGKVALVTGGGSGIGRATALAFAREKARVVVSDIDVKSGEETANMIARTGGEAIFTKADVSMATEVEALVAKAVETYGRLDCAHNNAGIELEVLVPDRRNDEETWDRVIDVNLKGVWLCMKYEIPQMLTQGGEAIVNTPSAAGLVGVVKQPAYVASKHGVTGLTKATALEYAKEGVRVNAVCSGVVDTPLVDRIVDSNPGVAPQRRLPQLVPGVHRGDVAPAYPGLSIRDAPHRRLRHVVRHPYR